MRNSRADKRSPALGEFGEAVTTRRTAAATILQSEERSTGPSLGTSSNTLPSRDKVAPVKRLVRLFQRSEAPRTDHVAEIAALERVMRSLFPSGCVADED